MICAPCLKRLRSTLQDAADLCAHIRSMVDPMKAHAFEIEPTFGQVPFAPAPLNVDLIDAGNEVIITLTWWASYFGDDTVYHTGEGFPSTVTEEEAYAVAKWASDYLLINLERISNDGLVVLFSRSVIDLPADRDGWTIRKALKRFPLEARSFWSSRPCPGCGLRGVRVDPPAREGMRTDYRCQGCLWEPPELERELWEMYFKNEGIAA